MVFTLTHASEISSQLTGWKTPMLKTCTLTVLPPNSSRSKQPLTNHTLWNTVKKPSPTSQLETSKETSMILPSNQRLNHSSTDSSSRPESKPQSPQVTQTSTCQLSTQEIPSYTTYTQPSKPRVATRSQSISQLSLTQEWELTTSLKTLSQLKLDQTVTKSLDQETSTVLRVPSFNTKRAVARCQTTILSMLDNLLTFARLLTQLLMYQPFLTESRILASTDLNHQ